MNFEIIPTSDFKREAKTLSKRYRSFKSDLKGLIESLEENPYQGSELSPGLRKIRMSITSKGKGKSGGARVITYTIVTTCHQGRVYLMCIYDKSEYSSVEKSIIEARIREMLMSDNKQGLT